MEPVSLVGHCLAGSRSDCYDEGLKTYIAECQTPCTGRDAVDVNRLQMLALSDGLNVIGDVKTGQRQVVLLTSS